LDTTLSRLIKFFYRKTVINNLKDFKMATRKNTILKCDQCGKEISDDGQCWFGGHPFSGWFLVKQHSGSTRLEELHRKKEWDICSKKCLNEFSLSNNEEYSSI
jgi:hypothetical protein